MEVKFQLYTQPFILGGSRLQSLVDVVARRSVFARAGNWPRFSSCESVALQIDTVANIYYSINYSCQLLLEGVINENVICLLVILI
jgi:hypothetical protein